MRLPKQPKLVPAFASALVPTQSNFTARNASSARVDRSVTPPPSFPRRSHPRCSQNDAQPRPKSRLGTSDLLVSDVCLGSMTWGVQNTREEAFAQLDYAVLDRGVNFIDTAEIYPVPHSDPRQVSGTTERYIGDWLQARPGARDQVVLATKITGFGRDSRTAALRHDPPPADYPDTRLDAASIRTACDASLRRLRTDRIDLYQLHWPDRYAPAFRSRVYDAAQEREAVPIDETVAALGALVAAGKIRAWGLSNETSFGVCEYVRAADAQGVARPASIQNGFSLVNRSFETELAETCAPRNHNVPLLAFSALGGGALTGKYNGRLGAQRECADPALSEARFVKYKKFMTRFTEGRVLRRVEEYRAVAEAAGMSVGTMAQAFCKSRRYVGSTIVGATSLEQLRENVDAFDVELGEDVLAKIDEIHNQSLDVSQSV